MFSHNVKEVFDEFVLLRLIRHFSSYLNLFDNLNLHKDFLFDYLNLHRIGLGDLMLSVIYLLLLGQLNGVVLFD